MFPSSSIRLLSILGGPPCEDSLDVSSVKGNNGKRLMIYNTLLHLKGVMSNSGSNYAMKYVPDENLAKSTI
jgi:hypothetical protein